MVRDAIAAGAGVALAPQSIIESLLQNGELVTWGAGDVVELWISHTSRRLQSPKVRAFMEYGTDRVVGMGKGNMLVCAGTDSRVAAGFVLV